jgi:hypothetical protein
MPLNSPTSSGGCREVGADAACCALNAMKAGGRRSAKFLQIQRLDEGLIIGSAVAIAESHRLFGYPRRKKVAQVRGTRDPISLAILEMSQKIPVAYPAHL